MSEKQYVRYKNDPNGTKWEVSYEDATDYQVQGNNARARRWFPKSEYIPCAPPERWVDVTAECRLTEGAWPPLDGTANAIQQDSYILWRASSHASGYRLRKVQLYTSIDGQEVAGEQWAFIVEKRED